MSFHRSISYTIRDYFTELKSIKYLLKPKKLRFQKFRNCQNVCVFLLEATSNSIETQNNITARMVIFTYIYSQYNDTETFYRIKMHQILAEKFKYKQAISDR